MYRTVFAEIIGGRLFEILQRVNIRTDSAPLGWSPALKTAAEGHYVGRLDGNELTPEGVRAFLIEHHRHELLERYDVP